MPTTPRLGWIYPTEDQKDWWDIWVALMNQIEADVWASFENAYFVLSGGGTINFTPGSGLFEWSADLYLISTMSGGKARIPAGDITLADGEIAYIEIARPLSSNYDVTLQKTASPLTGQNQRNHVFVALRQGSEVIMRPFATVV